MKRPHSDRLRRSLTRRDFIKLSGVISSAVALSGCAAKLDPGSQRVPTPVPPPIGTRGSAAPTDQAVQSPTPSSVATMAGPSSPVGPGGAIRIAHISDMHIQPAGPGVEGFTRALRHLQALDPPVDFIINAGDCVMDSLEAGEERVRAQWEAFNAVLGSECKLPVYHAIGNHDVWGWGSRSAAENHPLYGKAMALQQLRLPDRYYRFDVGAWRFLVLDSTHPAEVRGELVYTGKLDDEQFSWLESELAATPSSTPVCIVSHIPILAACEFLDGDNEVTGNWIVPGAWVHIDARQLWKLFWQHPKVKLCLSGHTHQVEDLRYHGVKYLTNGAISANWWRGAYFDFPPGYVVLTLKPDGSSESEFVAY